MDETERFEQALQVQEEGGILFEPFSLKQEREEGYFDESGNYVERKNDEDDKDAWLASDGGAQPCCTQQVAACAALPDHAAAAKLQTSSQSQPLICTTLVLQVLL